MLLKRRFLKKQTETLAVFKQTTANSYSCPYSIAAVEQYRINVQETPGDHDTRFVAVFSNHRIFLNHDATSKLTLLASH